jgi:hypothetical protein
MLSFSSKRFNYTSVHKWISVDTNIVLSISLWGYALLSGVDTLFYAFIIQSQEYDQSVPHSVRLTFWESTSGTHLIEIWAATRRSLDVFNKNNIAILSED